MLSCPPAIIILASSHFSEFSAKVTAESPEPQT